MAQMGTKHRPHDHDLFGGHDGAASRRRRVPSRGALPTDTFTPTDICGQPITRRRLIHNPSNAPMPAPARPFGGLTKGWYDTGSALGGNIQGASNSQTSLGAASSSVQRSVNRGDLQSSAGVSLPIGTHLHPHPVALTQYLKLENSQEQQLASLCDKLMVGVVHKLQHASHSATKKALLGGPGQQAPSHIRNTAVTPTPSVSVARGKPQLVSATPAASTEASRFLPVDRSRGVNGSKTIKSHREIKERHRRAFEDPLPLNTNGHHHSPTFAAQGPPPLSHVLGTFPVALKDHQQSHPRLPGGNGIFTRPTSLPELARAVSPERDSPARRRQDGGEGLEEDPKTILRCSPLAVIREVGLDRVAFERDTQLTNKLIRNAWRKGEELSQENVMRHKQRCFAHEMTKYNTALEKRFGANGAPGSPKKTIFDGADEDAVGPPISSIMPRGSAYAYHKQLLGHNVREIQRMGHAYDHAVANVDLSTAEKIIKPSPFNK